MKRNEEDELLGIKSMEYIECLHCHKKHNIKDNSFFSFYGNVHIGLCGGIIGNNFEKESWKFKSVSYFCRTQECMKIITDYIEI